MEADAAQLLDGLIDSAPVLLAGASEEELDNLNARIMDATTALKRTRNASVPVNKLPPSVLEVIFAYCQDLLPNFMPFRRYDYDSSRWTSMRLVCRAWEDVIASCTRLWRIADSARSPGTFLSRSGDNTPLVVYWGLRRGEPSIVEVLTPHVSRIQELHLNLSRHRREAVDILQSLSAPALLLESLTIYSLGHLPSFAQCLLPPALFAGHTPRLRRLTLEHFCRWPHHVFTGLTHVCLQRQSRGSRPTTNEFLDFLEGCPDLEELQLFRAGPTLEADPPVEEGRRVVLGRLRELGWGRLRNLAHAGRLLAHLTLPDEKTRLYFWDGSSSSACCSIGGLVPKKDLGFLTCMTNVVEWRLITAHGSTPLYATRFVAFVDGVLYTLGLLNRMDVADIPAAYGGVVKNVRKLTIYDGVSVPTETWRQVFLSVPRLEELVIRPEREFDALRVILNALYRRTWPWPMRMLKRPPDCPKLNTLRVQCAAGSEAFFISQFAKARKKRGCPMKRVEICWCGEVACTGCRGAEPQFEKADRQVMMRWAREVVYKGDESLRLEAIEGWPTKGYTWTAL
ncbi:hypothetical protein CPB85DRAFT_1315446 [Mucidula mucida]|nr:hypothetical protein CPB85DRAFT_1315446 [Mucidula mucida]